MTAEKIEKVFWLLLLVWFIIRTVLLGCQYFGNRDPGYLHDVLRHFTQQEINAGREYAMAGFWFKAVYGTFFLLLLVALLRSGFFAWLFNRITALTGSGLLRNDLVFTLAFLALVQMLNFPSSLYFGYLREVEAGFANIDLAGWLIRFCKSAFLTLALESFCSLVFLAVLKKAPLVWPFLLPVVMSVLALIIINVSPVLITPLFYQQQPLAAGEFRDRLLKMSQEAGMKVDEIYVVDESRYSRHTNAYFTGIGKFRRIVLYDNLVNSHTPDEAALIFAHEAGHWKYNHVAWGVFAGALGLFAVCIIYASLFPVIASIKWLGFNSIASAQTLPFLMIMGIILQLIAAPAESQISQFMERQADQASLELTGLKDVYISAQKRLSRDNRSDLLPSPLRVFWLYSHPPALERIKMAEAYTPAISEQTGQNQESIR
jgi:STE24 endopeptidase